jgi:SAM-dependent methyltransferase
MDIEKQIGHILQGYQPPLVLMTANQLGIFEKLAGAPVTAKQVADALSLSVKGTERLLNALVGMEVLVKEDNRFHLPEEWQKYLTEKGDHCMKQWIQLIYDILPVWTQLPEFVRSGNLIKSIMDMLGTDPENMRAFIDAMHDKGLKATEIIAREIPVGDANHMLDVGGGPGTYSLEWAKLHNHLKATVFDIPPVLEVAKDYIKRYGLENRVDTLAGDFNKDDLGSGYDLILVANVLHMYDADLGQSLVNKVVTALEPGGRIILHGFCTNQEGTGPLPDAMFNLNIGLLTEDGSAHAVDEMTRWLEKAGVSDIRHFRMEAVPTGVITGMKSG